MPRINRPEVLWPAGVVLLLVTGMALTFGVLYFARSDGGAQVVERYYRQGVAWDSVASARSELERSGLSVTIDVAPVARPDGTRRVVIGVVDANGMFVRGLEFEVAVFQPSRSAALAVLEAAESDSAYVVELPVPGPGLWDFEMSGMLDGRPFGLRARRELYR